MLKARMMFHLMLIMIIEGVLMKVMMGKVYNVGDCEGWTTLDYSNYATGASSKKFRVGDALLFHYSPTNHSLIQVNQHAFRSCNISTPLKTYETGNDSFIIKAPGHYFFICGFPGHCDAGQKLNVRVLKKYSKTTTPYTNFSPLATTTATGPPKMTKIAPKSVASVATDLNCLFRSIVVFAMLFW